MITPKELRDLIQLLPFRLNLHREDLGLGSAAFNIEDPLERGIPVSLVLGGADLVGTFGVGTVVDLDLRGGGEDLAQLLTDLFSNASHESWSAKRHVLQLQTGPRQLRFTSLNAGRQRRQRLNEVQTNVYEPYSRR